MNAEIITIGDEILIGQIVDTNSAWMGQKLNLAGIRVAQITSISDNADAIKSTLGQALERSDIVLITGGLGPTRDDITKQTLASFFNMNLVVHQETLEHVEAYFRKNNRPLLDVNKKQAEVPEGCTVIKNQNGTAPCMWFNVDGKIVVSMPGVPFEMKYLMEEEIIPKLKVQFSLPHIYHKTLLTADLGESFLAEKLRSIEDGLPKHISLAYLPKLGQVRLRLSGSGTDVASLEAEINSIALQISAKVEQHLVAEIDTTLEAAVLERMRSLKFSLSSAESCTGGLIAQLLTSIAGSSEVFMGGAVTYTNAMKTKVLGVKPETLEKYGAVSEETVKEMALGAVKQFSTDFAVATTGIAGPGGAEAGKPVGTVWIAVAQGDAVSTKLLTMSGRRTQIIERATMSTFIMLLNHLKNQAK